MVNQATSDNKNWKDIFVFNYVQMSSDQWQYASFSSDSLFQCSHCSAQPAHQRQTGAQLSGHDCTFWLVQKISRSVLELGYASLMHLLFQLLCQNPVTEFAGCMGSSSPLACNNNELQVHFLYVLARDTKRISARQTHFISGLSWTKNNSRWPTAEFILECDQSTFPAIVVTSGTLPFHCFGNVLALLPPGFKSTPEWWHDKLATLSTT